MEKQPIKKANILVVDDENRAREELSEMLGFCGYNVYRARSGRDAVTKVKKRKEDIDIIIMDIKMPGKIDGIDAVREIHQIYQRIPVILVTAHADYEDYQQRIHGANLKIAGFVDKPIVGDNKEKLMKLIEEGMKTKTPITK